ncbi:venom protease-like [Chironomus tepperi]|uniref:venom protease-like n=1 Tax=Chironomus tepperi TaxID=113505 RepID=UPI00391F94BF
MRTVISITLCFLFFSTVTNLESGSECKTKSNENGTCKIYRECPSIRNKLMRREMSMGDVIRCNNYGVICCPNEIQRNVGDISKRKCKEIEKFTRVQSRVGVNILNPNGTLIFTSKCKHKSIGLIVGGKDAAQYEFPHQALLGYKTGRGVLWACGGSLISSNYVLTAAHCNLDASLKDIKFVKLGMIDRLQNDQDVTIYNVKEVTVHPQYDRITYKNDIALVKLETNVNFSEFLYPICLPTRQHDEPKALATGLGRTGKEHQLSEKLLKVVLEKFSHRECQEKIRSMDLDKSAVLCYGDHSESRDVCRGDSGGPIQVANDAESHCTYKILGVVSYGASDCGTPGVPSVYVNVYNYLAWIEGIVWKDEQ